MNIGLLNEEILIQKNTVLIDAVGNHSNAWIDYYKCHATVSGSTSEGQYGTESHEAGQTVDVTTLNFTVRYCVKAAAVDVVGYRILFKGEIYDIIAIDHMSFKKKSLKFRAKKARR